MRIPFRRLIQGTIVACLVANGPAQAADIDRSTPLDRLVDRFIELVLPPSPTEALNSVSPDAGIFWSLIADCGYRIAEVMTEAGIPPRVTVRLERTLELAEEDRTWIGRRLDTWAADDGGTQRYAVAARRDRLVGSVGRPEVRGGRRRYHADSATQRHLPAVAGSVSDTRRQGGPRFGV